MNIVNQTSFTFTVFSVMVGVLLSGAWSNVYVFAQQSSLPWSPSASLQQSSSSDGGSNTPGWTSLATAASEPVPIAPQQLAMNQQQQPQLLSNNGTGIQDYTLTSNSPVVAPDKLMYLGYHEVSTNNNNLAATKTSTSTSDIDHSSSSKDKHKPDSHNSDDTTRESSIGDSKSPAHHSSSSTSRSSSIGKTTTSTSETSSKDIKPCTHNNSFPRETSEPKDHTHPDCENNIVKNKGSPKGHNDHNGSGDRFLGSDSFFNGDTFFSTVGNDIKVN